MDNVTTTTSDNQMTKIKVIDLESYRTLMLITFLFEFILSRKTTFEFLKFEFQNFQTTLDGETTKIKVVDPKKLYNFVVDNFLI